MTLIITGNQNSTAGRPSPSPHLSPWAVVSLERCDLMKGLLDECGFLAAVTMREVMQQPSTRLYVLSEGSYLAGSLPPSYINSLKARGNRTHQGTQ